jgi:centrosomal protein CEP19
VKKDVNDISFSDFQPKRFALSYDPPTIVLEYLVPSTGKLYHHKMRLRNLTKESKIDEMMVYLEQRHPLYFMNPILKKAQIRNLVERLQFRMKGS